MLSVPPLLVETVKPRPQRTKSWPAKEPVGNPTRANVLRIACEPTGMSVDPLRLVTRLRLRPQTAPKSQVRFCVLTGWKFVVTSQPLFVIVAAFLMMLVLPLDGGVGAWKMTSDVLES